MNNLEVLAQRVTTTFLGAVEDNDDIEGICLYNASPLELVRLQRALLGVFLKRGISYEYRIRVDFLDSDCDSSDLVYVDVGKILGSAQKSSGA